MLALALFIAVESGFTESWGAAVKYFGIPGACALALLYSYQKGWFISAREAVMMREQHAEVVKLLNERYDDLETESTSRLELLRTEKDMWRQMALKAANVAETATANVKSGG